MVKGINIQIHSKKKNIYIYVLEGKIESLAFKYSCSHLLLVPPASEWEEGEGEKGRWMLHSLLCELLRQATQC